MKKLILCMLFATALLLTACDKDIPGQSDPADTTPSTTLSSENTNQDTQPTTEKEPETFIPTAERDSYSEVNEASHLAIILSDGDSSAGDLTGVIFAVYPVSGTVRYDDMVATGFTCSVNKRNFLYHYTVEGKGFAIPYSLATYRIPNSNANIYLTEPGTDYTLLKTNHNIRIFSQDKAYSSKYNIYGNGWYCDNQTLADSETQSTIYLKIGETGDSNIYCDMTLSSPAQYGDSFIDTVNTMVENNEFAFSLYMVESANNLSDAALIAGKEMPLENTLCYQDIVSGILADRYGLAVKDKASFYEVDSTDITYAALGADGHAVSVVFDYFENASQYRSKDFTYDFQFMFYDDSQHYEYTDANGNTYEYYLDYELNGLLVYKNKQFQGIVKTDAKDVFEGISLIFGLTK